MKAVKAIFILFFLVACNPSSFYEDFESYTLGDSTEYRIYPYQDHTDKIINLNNSQVYKMTQNSVYEFCSNPITEVSFDLMIPEFLSEIYMFATSYDFKIRMDGSIVSNIPVDFLLPKVWHHIDMIIYSEINMIDFTLDGNTNKIIWKENNLKIECFVFVLTEKANMYIDNIYIF